MKKVGIITYYNIYNYGSVLQAYALINYVRELGYEAVLIDYNNMKKIHNIITKISTYKNRFLTCLIRPILFNKVILGKKVGNRTIATRSDDLKCKFDTFICNNLYLSDENYRNSEESGFAAFICGSDQIWQLNAPGLHELFYLRFAPEYMRIAYAPSFAGTIVPQYNKRRLKKYLKEIPYISTREDTGTDVVINSIGRKVPYVLDPVLLVGNNFWDKDIKNEWKNKKSYLACYFLSNASHAYEAIDELCKNYDLEIIWITSGNPLVDKDYHQYNAEPLEFVSIIKHAKFVCTDSLHGTEFSILLKTPFYVFERNYEVVPEQRTRIDSLLKITHFEKRLVKNSFNIDINEAMNIDFSLSEKIMIEERKKSVRFLANSLSKVINSER